MSQAVSELTHERWRTLYADRLLRQAALFQVARPAPIAHPLPDLLPGRAPPDAADDLRKGTPAFMRRSETA